MESTERVGARVRQLREERDWTQGQLATYAKVSPAYVSRLEGGELKRTSALMLEKIARALRVPLDQLVAARELPPMEQNDLPEFHWYVSRKFKNDKQVRETLIQVYEAIQSVKREVAEEQARKEEQRRQGGNAV